MKLFDGRSRSTRWLNRMSTRLSVATASPFRSHLRVTEIRLDHARRRASCCPKTESAHRPSRAFGGIKGATTRLTAPAYWKFESIFLQRRVRCEPVSRENSPSYVEKPRFPAG